MSWIEIVLWEEEVVVVEEAEAEAEEDHQIQEKVGLVIDRFKGENTSPVHMVLSCSVDLSF